MRTGVTTRFGLAEPVGAPGEQVGGEDADGQLHELRGLEPQHAGADPPGRAAGRHPHAGDEHGHEQAEGDDEERGAQDPPPAVVEAHGEEQGAGADAHPQDLAEEDGPRRAVLLQGDDGRCRAHHDQAEHAEDGDHDGEGGGRRHPPGSGLGPARRSDVPRRSGRLLRVTRWLLHSVCSAVLGAGDLPRRSLAYGPLPGAGRRRRRGMAGPAAPPGRDADAAQRRHPRPPSPGPGRAG